MCLLLWIISILNVAQAAPYVEARDLSSDKGRDSVQPWVIRSLTPSGILAKRLPQPNNLQPRSRFGSFVKAPWSMTPVVARELVVNSTVVVINNSTVPMNATLAVQLNGTLANAQVLANGTLVLTPLGNSTLLGEGLNSTLTGSRNSTARRLRINLIPGK